LRTKFGQRLDKRNIAERLGIDIDVPTVVVMGGGQGLGPIKEIVKSLLKGHSNFQIIVLAGTNKKIVRSLRRYAKGSQKKIFIYEYAKNVDEFMEIASMIITKPGGMTTAECRC